MKNNKNKHKIILFILCIYLLIPIFFTFINSIFRDFTGIVPIGFTIDFYRNIFTAKLSLVSVLLRTILISVLPVIFMTIVVLLLFFSIKLYFPRIEKYMNILANIPYGIQGIILAVSLVSIYSQFSNFLGNRLFILFGGYSIAVLPYIYQGIKNALATIEIEPIINAAELLGCRRLKAYFFIIIPSIYKEILSIMVLSIGVLFGDFVLINIIVGSSFPNVGIFLNKIMYISGHEASAVSCVMFLCMYLISKVVKEEQVKIRR